jgi:sRNA-binding carbon storage regulator CsrA
VKLGIRSPAEVPIHRQEVYRKITVPAPPQTTRSAVADNT